MRKIAILLSLTAITGCLNPDIRMPPVPPDWDVETCEPSDYTYVSMAKDDQDRPPHLKPHTSAKQAHEEALARLSALGYELKIGRPPGYAVATDTDQQFCGTTLPGHVYISKECYEKKGDNHLEWARFLRHEETHARQQTRMGLYFFLVYGYGEGRLLSIETPAYDEEYDTQYFFMTDQPNLGLEMPSEENMTASARGIYKQYSGAHIPKECFAQIATDIWSDR